MASFHVRCRKCDARRVLPRQIDHYVQQPACRTCGTRNYRIDRWMHTRDTKKSRCDCAGYWFPHRQGSLFCWLRVDGSDRYPGDPDFADRNYDGIAA